ncbi:hypothetical protein [Imhoffiella purpurea]|uniref:Type II secretion system protein GspE N-terminal domain-containing protein n=1 Tax=Imhoffiella purpurea TaxID=1249627 RepID=W9V3I4_9GAMM|nr:hypothetical protein [Imhoffiella purpurea]EXJ14078.1 hypothetical protein D779_3040 [Imhoffiella purpurea]
MNNDMFDSLDVPILFGRYLVLMGLVREKDIAEAASVQRELNASPLFHLVERGILSMDQIMRARQYQREHMVTFCQASRTLGIMSEEGCAAMLETAAKQRIQIGDILVKQGKLSGEQLAEALSKHQEHQESRNPSST